ncbi:phosphatidylinositol-4-phosphate 5-kinase-like protein 1 [Perkinsus chesapeaki]|uniref:Phosphatidylinositol-4-phosphate 5-kinase-like protein 1 n=1 Tax=Perkinsus chesapeaki TaxID=330153 RepID=A0A7J6MEX3_PERCH|nr:phosphatidylinositol-4-phosphate 5-kinase-like protein 1 [Perkinsus chesapeaki]
MIQIPWPSSNAAKTVTKHTLLINDSRYNIALYINRELVALGGLFAATASGESIPLIPQFHPDHHEYTIHPARGDVVDVTAVGRGGALVGLAGAGELSYVFKERIMVNSDKPEKSVNKAHLSTFTVNDLTLSPPVLEGGVSSYELKIAEGQQDVTVVAEADELCGAEVCIGNCFNTTMKPMATKTFTLNGSVGPPWSDTQIPITVRSEDKIRKETFVLNVRREVSSVAQLSGLNTEDCQLSPPFHPDVTDYSCKFSYNVTMTAKLTPLLDMQICKGCTILAPDNTVPHNMRNDFSEMRPRQWSSGRVWFRKLLYGEHHIIPFTVYAQDGYHRKVYNVYIECVAPWYMRADVTRSISSVASATAAVMSVAKASNLMALAKQVQFMSLTARIAGVPQVYVDYTKSMDGFSLQFGFLPDNWGEMSPESIRKYIEVYILKTLNEVLACQEALGIDYHLPGDLLHPERIALKFKFDGDDIASIFDEPQSWLFGGDDDEWMRRRRLDASQDAHVDLPKDPNDLQIFCDGAREEVITKYQRLLDIQEFVHTVCGNVIFQGIGMILLFLVYWIYYYGFAKRWRCRMEFLEPYPMWTFILDFGFIGFSSAACSTLFSENTRSIYIFGWQPSRDLVVFSCITGLLLYPIGYLVFIYLKLSQLQSSGELVYNTRFRKYTDRAVDTIKVKVDPPIPSWIPILSQVATRRISCAIPIKDERGCSVHFDEDKSELEDHFGDFTPLHGSFYAGASLDEFSRPFLPPSDGQLGISNTCENNSVFILTDDVCRGRVHNKKAKSSTLIAEDDLFALTGWLYERAEEERCLLLDYGIMRLVALRDQGRAVVPDIIIQQADQDLAASPPVPLDRGFEVGSGYQKILADNPDRPWMKKDVNICPWLRKPSCCRSTCIRAPDHIDEIEKQLIHQWLFHRLVELLKIKTLLAYCIYDNTSAKYSDRWLKASPLYDGIDELIELDFRSLVDQVVHVDPLRTQIFLDFASRFPVGTEPWLDIGGTACGERKDFRVTIDEEAFAHHMDNDENSLQSCRVLEEYPLAAIGRKYYRLHRADGREIRATIAVELRHVVTVMRYLPNFKLRVPLRNLDMKLQSDLKIILDTARNNGLFMYVVDRFVTLCTIVILTVDQGDVAVGAQKVLLFLILKLFILIYEVRLNMQDNDGIKRQRWILLLQSLLAGDSFVWFMQTLTLLVLLMGHSEVQQIPSPIASILGILITAATMLTMNWRSFRELLGEYSTTVSDRAVSVKNRLAFYAHRLRERLSKLHFLARYRSTGESVHYGLTIEGIDFAVPALGLFLNGRLEIGDTVSIEEKHLHLIEKGLYYHSITKEAFPHCLLESPRDLARYEADVKPRLTVVIEPRQLRNEEAIGDLAVTVQVVNHTENPSLCAPELDSYFSLYYPPNWRRETEGRERRKVEALAQQWIEQVDAWLASEIGAVKSSLTATADVLRRLHIVIREQLSGEHRLRNVRMRLGRVVGLNQSGRFYCCVLPDGIDWSFDGRRGESMARDRISKAVDVVGCECTFEENVDLTIPCQEQSIVLSVWKTVKDGDDEMVGYTRPIPLPQDGEDISFSLREDISGCINYIDCDLLLPPQRTTNLSLEQVLVKRSPRGTLGSISLRFDTLHMFARGGPPRSFSTDIPFIGRWGEQRVAARNQIAHFVVLADHLKVSKSWRPDPLPLRAALYLPAGVAWLRERLVKGPNREGYGRLPVNEREAELTASIECLLELTATHVVVKWRDTRAEKLIPFRRAIIEEYGCSWEFVFKIMKKAANSVMRENDEITENVDTLTEEEFVAAVDSLLPDLLEKEASHYSETPADSAHRIFTLLDISHRGFISIGDFKCDGTDARNSIPIMVEHRLPLSSLSRISPNFSDRTITLACDDKYATSGEWKALKVALDPEWSPPEVTDHRYSLESFESFQPSRGDTMTFSFPEGHFNMWQKVILKNNMNARRVVVEGYDGQVVDHPRISGCYMRDGWGAQEFPPDSNQRGEALVYTGSWKNHVFDGEGILARKRESTHRQRRRGILRKIAEGFAGSREASEDASGDIIYRGNWVNGKKHGRGTYYFDLRGPDDVAYHCIYEGEFRDDAFCGQGVFRVRDLELVARNENMYPDRIVSYYGTFAGEGNQRGGPGLNETTVYASGSRSRLRVARSGTKMAEFLEYFTQNDEGVQPCGRMPQDDTLSMYVSIKDVVAICLDGVTSVLPLFRDGISLVGEAVDMSLLMRETETYCGEMSSGRPHGRGVKRIPVSTLVAASPPHPSETSHDAFSRSMSSNISGGTVFTAFTTTTTVGGRGKPRSWIKELEIYDGQWRNGLKHGQGRMEFRDGVVYEGQWREDLRHGQGFQTIEAESKVSLLYGYFNFPPGAAAFDGVVRAPESGRPNVYILLWLTGQAELHSPYERYEGGFDGDIRTGHGKIVLTDSSFYEGNFSRNQRHDPEGNGKLFDGDGHLIYEGSWDRDRRTPWCRMMRLQNGHVYTGDLDSYGRPSGKGSLYPSEAMAAPPLYEGQWKAGRFHGEGVLVQNDSTYQGQWFEGRMHGKGVLKQTGVIYDGEWDMNQRQGRGKVTVLNGQYSYTGDWANDVPHGHGDLEDPRFIHENVVFHQGVCQMPFVEEGAPVVSLADCMPINTRTGRQALEDAISMVKPRVEVGKPINLGYGLLNADEHEIYALAATRRPSRAIRHELRRSAMFGTQTFSSNGQ